MEICSNWERLGTWLQLYLSREAASMRAIAMEPDRRLYLVTMKVDSSR
ncbi:MAG TPA: hypothetical protein VGF61_16195 [Candidatus Acidoferrum sp.]